MGVRSIQSPTLLHRSTAVDYAKLRKLWKSCRSMKFWSLISRCRVAYIRAYHTISPRKGRDEKSLTEYHQGVAETFSRLNRYLDKVMLQLDNIDDRLAKVEAAAISADIITQKDVEKITSDVVRQFGITG